MRSSLPRNSLLLSSLSQNKQNSYSNQNYEPQSSRSTNSISSSILANSRITSKTSSMLHSQYVKNSQSIKERKIRFLGWWLVTILILVLVGTYILFGRWSFSVYRPTSTYFQKPNQKLYHQYVPIRWKAGQYYVSNIADNIVQNLQLILKSKSKLDSKVVNSQLQVLYPSIYHQLIEIIHHKLQDRSLKLVKGNYQKI